VHTDPGFFCRVFGGWSIVAAIGINVFYPSLFGKLRQALCEDIDVGGGVFRHFIIGDEFRTVFLAGCFRDVDDIASDQRRARRPPRRNPISKARANAA